jgi:hypothetical protein
MAISVGIGALRRASLAVLIGIGNRRGGDPVARDN